MFKVNAWIWAAVCWVGLIFFSSTSLASEWAEQTYGFVSAALLNRPAMNVPSDYLLHLLADKGFHVSLFCVLAVLLWLALDHAVRKPWLIVICGAVVGSMSEFLQRFFPGRDPALRDVLINIGGTALGTAICLAVVKRRATRSPAPL